MSEAKCPECDLAQHRGDCFDDEIDARLSKSLRAEGERLRARAHGGDSITYVERCDSCETFRQRMIAEKARAEKAEARLTRLLALDGTGNLTVDEVQERIDAAEARAEKAERERDEDRRREYGYSQQTVDALAGERDRLRARAEKAERERDEIKADFEKATDAYDECASGYLTRAQDAEARAETLAAALREIAFDWPDGKNRWADAAEIAARALAEGEGKE